MNLLTSDWLAADNLTIIDMLVIRSGVFNNVGEHQKKIPASYTSTQARFASTAAINKGVFELHARNSYSIFVHFLLHTMAK